MKKFWNLLMSWAESIAEYRRRSNQYRGYY